MPISIVCCAQAARCSGADVSQSAPGRSAGAPNTSRRRLGSQLSAAAALSVLLLPRPLPAAALTPYQRGLALEYGLSADGRIRSCPSDANPNCISTSGNNTTFMPAWEAPQGRPADAMSDFEAALEAVAPGARLVASSSSEGREYRRWQVADKLFDHDDIEVVIGQQRAPYEAEPPLVTFRSMAAEVKYIWPIQQAITDFGAQRQRLKEVRKKLGWRILGCDLVECYEE